MKKKRKININFLLPILLLMLLASCTSTKLLQNNNFAVNMLDGPLKALTGMQVYGATPDSIDIYLQIDPSLLIPHTLPDSTKFLSFSLQCMIFPSFSKKLIIDSYTFRTGHLSINQTEKLIFKHSLKAPLGQSYYLCFKPSSEKFMNWNFTYVDRNFVQSQNHFLINFDYKTPVFHPEDFINKPLFIQYSQSNKDSVLFLRRVDIASCRRVPPFMMKTETCNLKFTQTKSVKIHEGKSEKFLLNQGGLYLIQTDTSALGAGSFLVINQEFQHWLYLTSLRYITDNDEFVEVWRGDIGLLDFWENIAGSTQRTIELSKRFNYAVNMANLLFTRTLPGCLTDRGMIYIVFGPPDVIYEDDELETWVYRGFRQQRDLFFNFRKEWILPVGFEYTLERSPEYTQLWYEAIERWRR